MGRRPFQNLCLALLALVAGAVAASSASGQSPAKGQDCCAPAAKKKGKSRPPKVEKLACKLGDEDNHARIAVELHDGRVNRFAYYSKWKPRTCSMEVERDDAYSKWADTGDTTVVTLIEDKGAFLIENGKGRYHFIFREIDRMRYCGMEGKVSGSLTIYRGRSQCVLSGVMERDGAPEKPAPKAAAGPDGVGTPPPAIPVQVNPAPVTSAPAQPAPAQPAQAQSAPGQPASAKPAPTKTDELKKP